MSKENRKKMKQWIKGTEKMAQQITLMLKTHKKVHVTRCCSPVSCISSIKIKGFLTFIGNFIGLEPRTHFS